MNNTKILVLDALLIAITIVSKEALSFLANIEVVTLFMVIFAINLSLKDSILIAIVYSFVESLLYGVNIYTFSYFVVWVLIVYIAYILKRYLNNYIRVAILNFILGMLFDIPFSIPFFLMSFKTGISYLLAGIVFTLVHAIGNFIIAVILFDGLDNAFKELLKRMKIGNFEI